MEEQSVAFRKVPVPTVNADTRKRNTGKSMRGNDIAEALRAFQGERAGTGVRIVYKIAR